MKIVVKKEYYEENIYRLPSEGEIAESDLDKSHFTLIHAKGDFYQWLWSVKKYCCEPLKKCSSFHLGGHWMKFNEDIMPHCYLGLVSSEVSEHILISFCHFCGKKIEIEEDK